MKKGIWFLFLILVEGGYAQDAPLVTRLTPESVVDKYEHCKPIMQTIFNGEDFYRYDGGLKVEQAKVRNYKVDGAKTTFELGEKKYEIINNNSGGVKSIFIYSERNKRELLGIKKTKISEGQRTLFDEKNGKCIIKSQDFVFAADKKPEVLTRSFDFDFCQKFQNVIDSEDFARCEQQRERVGKVIESYATSMASQNIIMPIDTDFDIKGSYFNQQVGLLQSLCSARIIVKDGMYQSDFSFGKMIRDWSLFVTAGKEKENDSKAKILNVK